MSRLFRSSGRGFDAISRASRNYSFSGSDLRRLDRVIHTARCASTASASSLVAPGEEGGEAARLTDQHCVFDRSAVLLFPRDIRLRPGHPGAAWRRSRPSRAPRSGAG